MTRRSIVSPSLARCSCAGVFHRASRDARAVAAAIALTSVAVLFGCATDPTQGYSFSSTFRSDVPSVHVPIWQNLTFSRGLENDLSEAIAAEIRRGTPMAVTSAEAAASELTGTIVSTELKRLTTSSQTGLVEQLGVVVLVDFQWRESRTGRVLVARRSFSGAGSFTPAQGVSERLERGQRSAVQELARAIVNEMRSGF